MTCHAFFFFFCRLNWASCERAVGDFTIPDVTTTFGDVVVEVVLEPGGGADPQRASSEPTSPVLGGTTDVGTVTLSSAAVETDFGNDLGLGNDEATDFSFAGGFEFPFLGTSYTNVFVSSNGLLSFDSGVTDGDWAPIDPATIGECNWHILSVMNKQARQSRRGVLCTILFAGVVGRRLTRRCS